MQIEIKNLRKTYENTVALDNVSFTIPNGSIFGLLGPNGAGKTTFIRILTRIIAYDSGEILLDGEPLDEKHSDLIGYLPEERGLYKKMTVGEQIIYFAQLKGLSHAEAKRRATELLKKFDMLGWWNKKLEELSKGMQQKVQFVITIIHDPKILIFDEPFTGFDPINQEMLKNEIRQLNQQGKTILFSTHIMSSVEEICDSIVLINKGKVLLQGKIQDIKQQFKENIYELTYQTLDSPLQENEHFKILRQKGNSYQIQIINPQMSANDLLSYAIQFGQIQEFKQILPSLNEIFIKIVNN